MREKTMADRTLQSFGLWLCLVACLAGCESKVERAAVFGAVSYDGEPVEDGQVAFEPLGAGEMEFAPITAGKYSLPAEYGLVPGEYIVRITGNRATGKSAQTDAFLQDADSLDIVVQFIPLKYNTSSQLKATIEPAVRVEKDFHLTSN